ncbi:uncharacterized protein BCR38DRAFT_490734 [Pseudomassariella vexata]|uniref:Uncharacterized protein n=1 Tax=Pseudomassariella vexata TaxID=1141098 RepID=A0A1Y2D9X5_9PEZI|nr:uncharacterized protein BCR38DRAFT_490734 [Pseudomassariella vexata]ORY56068.1 hypothetical protein BCR38DRAFT_490734 [Pseudomassariella vexata]
MPLWQSLGLSIELVEVDYDAGEDGPNLYFEVEHPDKSAALLSPTHVRTSNIEGVSYVFSYYSSGHSSQSEQRRSSRLSGTERHFSPSTHELIRNQSYGDNFIPAWGIDERGMDVAAAEDFRQRRQRTIDLAAAALHKVIGIRTVVPGTQQVINPMTASLLRLAPSVWNAYYEQRIVAYARNFPIISSIVSSAHGWQSASLVRKVAELLKNDQPHPIDTNLNDGNDEFQHTIQSSVNRILWKLLRTRLKVTTGTQTAGRIMDQDSRTAMFEDFDIHLFANEREELCNDKCYDYVDVVNSNGREEFDEEYGYKADCTDENNDYIGSYVDEGGTYEQDEQFDPSHVYDDHYFDEAEVEEHYPDEDLEYDLPPIHTYRDHQEPHINVRTGDSIAVMREEEYSAQSTVYEGWENRTQHIESDATLLAFDSDATMQLRDQYDDSIMSDLIPHNLNLPQQLSDNDFHAGEHICQSNYTTPDDESLYDEVHNDWISNQFHNHNHEDLDCEHPIEYCAAETQAQAEFPQAFQGSDLVTGYRGVIWQGAPG